MQTHLLVEVVDLMQAVEEPEVVAGKQGVIAGVQVPEEVATVAVVVVVTALAEAVAQAVLGAEDNSVALHFSL